MHQARIIITSDEIRAASLFLMMRKIEKAHPRGEFAGLCEKVVIQIEKEDFAKLLNPQTVLIPDFQVSKKDTTMQILLKLLKNWGNCSEEMLRYLQNADIQSPDQVQSILKKALNPDDLKELINQQRIEQHINDTEDSELQQSFSDSPSLSINKSLLDTQLGKAFTHQENLKLEELKTGTFERIDLMSNNQIKKRLQTLLEKYILPLDEVKKVQNLSQTQTTYEKLYETVKELNGKVVMKEYYETIERFRLLKTRETFISLIQNGDLDKILPLILSSVEKRQKFSDFIKITYNEAKKSNSVRSDNLIIFIKNILESLVKKAKAKDELCSDYITNFLFEDIIQNSFKSFQATIINKSGARVSIVESNFYKEEDLAMKYACPSLFYFMTKTFMAHQKDILRNHPTLLTDLLTIALANALHMAENSTNLLNHYMELAMEIVYFSSEHLASFNIITLQNLLQNTLALHLCEQLQNNKENEKSQNCQKLLTEMYVQLMNIKDRVQEMRKVQLESTMRVNKYLNSMKKMDRIIKEMCQANCDYKYLQYLEFYKTCDKDLLKFLNIDKKIETEHNMYETPIKSYHKVNDCKRIKITVGKQSRLPPFHQIAITSDEKGEHIMELIQANDENSNDQKFDYYTNEFYLHYPAKRPHMVAFGSQKWGKLGSGKNGSDCSLINIPLSLKINVKEVFARKKFSVMVDKDNLVYMAGYMKNMSEKTRFTHLPLPNEVNMEQVSVGNSSILVMGTDQKFYWMGKNKSKLYKDADENQDKFVPLQAECAPRLTSGKICQIATGSKFCLFVTDKGQVYARGRHFLESICLPLTTTATLVPLPDHIIVKKAYVTIGAQDQSVAILDVIDKSENRRRKLLSAGRNRHGVIGQGGDIKHSSKFQDVKINYGLVQIIDVQMTVTHALAITKEGTLYAWGKNEKEVLGLESLQNGQNYYTPTPVELFEKYNIKTISTSENHTLVYAKKTKGTKELDQSTLFAIGKPNGSEPELAYYGITSKIFTEAKDKGPLWKIGQFEDCQIKSLSASNTSSLVFAETSKDIKEMSMHKINEKEFEEGVLHFYFDEKRKIKIVAPSKYEKEWAMLPPICFAIKYPIKNLQSKEFPDLGPIIAQMKAPQGDKVVHEGYNCDRTKEQITGARYFGLRQQQAQRDQKSFNYSEESFFKANSSDVDPIIYFRLTQELDKSIELPPLNHSLYYQKSDTAWGLDITVQPDYKTEISHEVIGQQQALYQTKFISMTYWDAEKINLLKEFINSLPLASDRDFLSEGFKSLLERRTKFQALPSSASDELITPILNPRYRRLVECSEDALQYIKGILHFQSKFLSRFMNIASMSRMKGDSIQEMSGWNTFMPTVKREMLAHQRKRVLNKMISTLQETSEGQVRITRRKAFYFAQSGEMDNEGKFTIFGQVFQQMRKEKYNSFKKSRVDAKVFNVTFQGEGASDAGGPFRDCITNMCKELQSGALPVLIKTANNKNSHGQYRDCWIPNPGSKTPTQLDMFVCFGAMIGWSIRSTSSLNLDLPPIFWKKIIGQEITEWDLKQIDTYTWHIVQDLKKYLKKQSIIKPEEEKTETTQPEKAIIDDEMLDQEFTYSVDEKFATLLSDGSEVELCFGGRSKQVTRENLDEYLKLLVKTRLQEFDIQMKSIKEGINIVIPDNILFYMSWQDVDLRSTGSKTIEISTLKSVTSYSSCSEDTPIIKWFWNIFKTFTEEERSMYLKFVWGRARLPMNLQDISRRHQIEYHRGMTRDSLPISHTCFFTIDLPEYSSEEVMRRRILYAIQYCGDIDADRGAHDIIEE